MLTLTKHRVRAATAYLPELEFLVYMRERGEELPVWRYRHSDHRASVGGDHLDLGVLLQLVEGQAAVTTTHPDTPRLWAARHHAKPGGYIDTHYSL